MGSDSGLLAKLTPRYVANWWRARTLKHKVAIGSGCSFTALMLLWALIENTDNLFVLAELVHFAGIGQLIWKLGKEGTCSGLSLRTQHLTIAFLSVRLYCSATMEGDVHTVLDLLTLVATGWVTFMMHTKLRSSYNEAQDTCKELYVAVPCFALAFMVHPRTSHIWINRLLWAFCVYTESISVLPQLRMMQKMQTVERFTANYVFALGVSRFLSCAHWIFQMLDGDSYLFSAVTSGMWPALVFLSEIVQTFILADFVFYYIKSTAEGHKVVRLPTGVV